jgi:FAD/FMN-containing dehydrogenase
VAQREGATPTLDDRVVSDLRAIVGDAHVLTDPDVTRSHATDWTGRFQGETPAVVRPADHTEVAAVVRACGDAGIALVPQGGKTGLVGGSVPLRGEVVVDLRRLTTLEPVDTTAMQVTAGAGVTLASLQAHAATAGLAYAVDLAARDSATLGGTIATNAGGIHVLRFGGTRRQLLGVRAVLGDASTVAHLGGLAKDNTGYDLAGLLCGSEGTLGIVTEARVRLVPRYEHVVVALVGFASLTDAVVGTAAARHALTVLNAAELILDDGLALVCRVTGLPRPFSAHYPVYVLLEAADHRDPTDALAGVVAGLSGVRDVAVASDAARRDQLWSYREQHTTAINTLGPPHKLDVTIPVSRLPAFVDEVRGAIRAVDAEAKTWLFGHVGDGNVHVNVTGVEPGRDDIDDAVLRLVADYGGSISAEHGIGTAKKAWLALNRTQDEIDAFRHIKDALDPHGILNPNVLLP